jgi:hypothetical protein
MSRKIVDRVWQHSKLSGANKLLLLALAEQADDDGFTWVSYKTLAPMVGVIERQVYRLVDNLIKKGELLVWEQQGQHGGRGYTNIYFVTTGLTQEQMAEVVRIRFDLVTDEIEAVISKKGDIYIKLCDVKRVAPATLERTKKSGGYVTLEDEKGYKKPDTSVTHNNDNSDVSVTQKNEANPENSQKPDTSVTRLLKESLNPESNPSKESKREREETHAQKLKRLGEVEYLSQNEAFAVKLTEVCGNPHPRYVVNGDRKKLAETTAQLLDWKATIAELEEFKANWKLPSPPYYHQVSGQWGRFLTRKHQPNGESNGTGYKTGASHRQSNSDFNNQRVADIAGQCYVYPDGHTEPFEVITDDLS